MTEQETAQRAILDILKALVVAWNTHDAHAYALKFAEDADFTNVIGMAMKGRSAIENSHALIFRTMFKDSQLAVRDTRIRFIRSDIAAVDVRWEMTGARDPLGNQRPVRQGLLNLITSEKNGAWLVDVFHNMDLPSPELVKSMDVLLNS